MIKIKHSLIIAITVISMTIKAQNITGLYVNQGTNSYPEVVLNLYQDSSFNYFFWKEGGYATTVIDRCGKFILKDNILILKSIIENDTINYSDSVTTVTNKIADYSDYFELCSDIYNQKPEICIQFEDSIRKLFPDIRIFLDFDFKHEIAIHQSNRALFEYPKTSVLRFINLRSAYFSIDIDFDSYYHEIDKKNWRVSKNLLTLKMKDKLMELRQMKFKTFAKYYVINNRLELKNAIEPDYENMLDNPITTILKKIN
jgi:hypothetical protein